MPQPSVAAVAEGEVAHLQQEALVMDRDKQQEEPNWWETLPKYSTENTKGHNCSFSNGRSTGVSTIRWISWHNPIVGCYVSCPTSKDPKSKTGSCTNYGGSATKYIVTMFSQTTPGYGPK